MSIDLDVAGMRLAIDQAKIAVDHDDAPIGAVLICDGRVLAAGETQVLLKRRDTAHAEINVISQIEINTLRKYNDVTLYCTLEPCVMCLGACIHAGVKRVVYGMRASTDGGTRLGESIKCIGLPCPEVVGGVCEAEIVEMMRKFVGNRTDDQPGVRYIKSILIQYS